MFYTFLLLLIKSYQFYDLNDFQSFKSLVICDMGVAVLQLYPGQENKTGPQIIETLTRRIVNLGAQQAGQFLVDCEVHLSVTTAGQQTSGSAGANKQLYILQSGDP